jgi:galactokinase
MAENALDLKNLIQKFVELYGGTRENISVFFAPGRVNLIGEHTDYNGGFVLPCSLHYGTFLLLRKTGSQEIRFKSMNVPETGSVHMKIPVTPVKINWINYPLGIVSEFQKKGLEIEGYDFLFTGDIPNSAGLSSSASIEIVTAFALNDLAGWGMDMLELVKLSQRAENDFVGMKCGIMDMFAVGIGKKDHAIFLNCDTLGYELVPVKLGKYSLMITNTNKSRRLADSKYNERRSQCENAVSNFQSFKPIRNLSGLNLEEFNQTSHLIKDVTVRKRARHVVSENQRTIDAVKVLKNNELDKFGQLMYESHNSLKEDYEVTCGELDILVQESSEINGVLGSRMTGAGFGGCTVSMVHEDSVGEFVKTVGENYKRKTGIEATFFKAKIGDGAKRIYF